MPKHKEINFEEIKSRLVNEDFKLKALTFFGDEMFRLGSLKAQLYSLDFNYYEELEIYAEVLPC